MEKLCTDSFNLFDPFTACILVSIVIASISESKSLNVKQQIDNNYDWEVSRAVKHIRADSTGLGWDKAVINIGKAPYFGVRAHASPGAPRVAWNINKLNGPRWRAKPPQMMSNDEADADGSARAHVLKTFKIWHVKKVEEEYYELR